MNPYEAEIQRKLSEYQAENASKICPNILILGATGCGKSSLVNTVFPDLSHIAPVNDIYRGTTDFKVYSGKECNLSINLIDSMGYEASCTGSSFDPYKKDVINYISDHRTNPLERIHLVWYCISVSAARIQPFDLDMLKELYQLEDVAQHVAVVLTKCDEDDEDGGTAKAFRSILKESLPFRLSGVFETSKDKSLPLQLNDLIHWSADALNDIDISGDLREGFIAAQMVDLDSKREAAQKAIIGYTSGAAVVGAAPIPFSDAFLLVPEQTVMCVHIIHIYGLDSYAGVAKSLVSDMTITNLGKYLASSLLKLFPGIGQAVGAAITASVASGLTGALGFAVSSICYKACRKIAQGERVDLSLLLTFEHIREEMKHYNIINSGKRAK